jgi:hypothetical protein
MSYVVIFHTPESAQEAAAQFDGTVQDQERELKADYGEEVSAVRLNEKAHDGWHECVSEFRYMAASKVIPQTQATWREGNHRFACPISSILAVRGEVHPWEKVAELPPDEDSRIGRPSNRLQLAVQWLEETLQDGRARRTKDLRRDAKDSCGITSDTLQRAYEAIPGHKKPFKHGADWFWQLEQTTDNDPQQSDLIRTEGAAE